MDYKMEELLLIVSELAQKYTSYDSTSVTYEKAQMLMEAVLFCLDEYNSFCADGLVHKDISVRDRYEAGMRLLSEKVEKIRQIFHEVSFSFEDFGVKCLRDTVQKGIPEFLKRYDTRFCPQNMILTLDYPLLTDCSLFAGADAVYRYIRGIRTEQRFLSTLDRNYVISVLEKYDSGYRDMADNICGIVLADMADHAAVKKLFDGTFREEGHPQWSEVSGIEQVPRTEDMVKNFVKKITKQFFHRDADMEEYLCGGVNLIAAQMNMKKRRGW